ncbi:hypothetical protein SDC9_161738 [bioreactor metagenome]|uniref:Uncharacterized protein n=1 Tax=bioreactor metagenome TaxID=1076179 RepID=A0A645FJ37_9ZZZZ
MLRHCQKIVNGGHFRYVTEKTFCFKSFIAETVYRDAAIKAQKTGNAFNKRRLSSAVRAEQNSYLSVIQMEIQIVIGKCFAVIF